MRADLPADAGSSTLRRILMACVTYWSELRVHKLVVKVPTAAWLAWPTILAVLAGNPQTAAAGDGC